MALTRFFSRSWPQASPVGFVCSRRLDFHLKTCALAALGALWMEAPSSAVTLLSSAEVSTVPVPIAPSSLPPALFSPGSGRIGPTTLPLGSASIAAQTIPPPPKPAAGEDTAQQKVRFKRPAVRPRRAPEEPAEKPRHRQREEEAETVSAPAPHARHAPIVPAPDYKTTEDYKSTPVLATTAKSPLNVEFGVAWYDKYYFRGVRILDAISSEKTRNGVVNADVVVGYAREHDAFTVGFNYVQALDRQQPKGAEFQVRPSNPKGIGEKFDLPSRDRYEEYNLNLAYIRDLAYNFRGTVEFNRYVFSNGTFYQTPGSPGINHADETVLKLDYTGFKNLTPSLSWAHDFDGFKGDFMEARVDGNYALPSIGGIAVGFKPYVSLSYDLSYNGTDNGFNSLEFGATIPFHLNSFLTFGLTANYVKELSRTEGNPRAKDGFWGGASFTIDWGGPVQDAVKPDDKKMVVAAADPGLWEVSVGASYRMFQYDFDHKAISPFDVSRIFTPRFASVGSHAIAGDNNVPVFYGTGAIFGQTTTAAQKRGVVTPAQSGVRQAFVQDPSFQYVGTFGKNAYVNFSSDTSTFSKATRAHSGHRQDEDSNASPYIDVDREVWRKDTWSLRVGLGYDFAASNSDSGYRLDRLDTIREVTNRAGVDYAIDNVGFLLNDPPNNNAKRPSQGPIIVVDAAKYASSLAGAAVIDPSTEAYLRTLTPGRDLAIVKQDAAAVATFVRSSFDLDVHELSIPISLRKDLGHRLHVEITVAPTLTLADAELNTDEQQRSLTGDDLGKPSITPAIKFTPGAQAPGGKITFATLPPAGMFGGGGGSAVGVNSPAASASPTAPPIPQNAFNGGGKAVTPTTPQLPGKLVRENVSNHSQLSPLFGVSATTKLTFDLNQEGTIYAELWGRYHYIETMHLTNGFGSGDIDLSGFQAGVGIGYRF